MKRISVEARCYKERPGKITNQQMISEYSVTSNRQVLNDRSNARYLIDENIRDDVNFDLTIGLKSFKDKSETLNSEPCLHPLCKWAIAQLGLPDKETATLKEVFQGAQFAACRGTLRLIANTIAGSCNSKSVNKEDSWTVVAQNFGGVILLGEQSKVYDGNSSDLPTYSGHKFEQYMTTDTPNGRPDTDSPIDSLNSFEMMVRSTLSVDNESLSICVGAEIDALRGDEPIELKTLAEGRENELFRNIRNVLQSEMVGVKSIVFGLKKRGEFTVHKVIERSLDEIKAISNGYASIGQKTGMGYSFLFTVLSEVKQFLEKFDPESREACQIAFDPFMERVSLKRISREEATANGNGVTAEFLNRFNLSVPHLSNSCAKMPQVLVEGNLCNRRPIKITIRHSISANSQEIPVDPSFYTRRPGKITNHQTISEYSVTSDRQVLNDRSNARYLVNENIRDEVNFDLTIGLESFLDKGETLQSEPCLHPLCKWAIAQEGSTLKEVFQGAEFAAWSGTMKRIAKTIDSTGHPWDKWAVVAQNFDGVILLSEQSMGFERDVTDAYSAHKFEQYMTTNTPNGRPDTDSPIDSVSAFEMMVRSTLSVGSESLTICVGAEIDALRGDEPIDLSTSTEGYENWPVRLIRRALQSEMVGVKTFVVGLKEKDKFTVRKVVEITLDEVKAKERGSVGQKTEEAYSFLFTVLSEVKQFLSSHEACLIVFAPLKMKVFFNGISRAEAKAKGNGVTDEFLTRFNL